MEFIKKYFKDKTAAFYAACALALISVITAIVYAAVFGGKQDYMSWPGFVLMLLAGVAFFALSVLGFAKWGIVAMSLLDFAALLVSALVTYNYFVGFAINGGIGAAFGDGAAVTFVVCMILLVICCVAGNIAAWLSVRKKRAAKQGEKV